VSRIILCICLIVACGGSKQPETKPVVTPIVEPVKPPVPATQLDAQAVLMLWLDAFNAGDERALTAFHAKHMTTELAKDFPVDAALLAFREQTGGFDIKKTVEATPTRFVAIAKERGADQFARVVIELDPSNTARTLDINPTPTPAEFKPAHMSEADAIAALRAEIDTRLAKDQFSGAVLVAKNGKAIFAQAYGMADREKQIANTLETRFRIGSMNKMFTAVATLQLVQAKKLSLDDTVDKHLFDYPNKGVASKVKLHHLLTHAGGTGDIFGPDYDAKRLELRSLQDYVKLYGHRDLLHEPGEKLQYSNYGFLLLGVIIERVTKQSYYDRVQASIFKPAKMTSTSSPFEDKPTPGRSIAYTKNLGGKRLARWTNAADTLPIRATSAGGGDSTVGDLLRFANALTSNKLLDAKHTELLTTGKVGEPDGRYAYGFAESIEDGVRCFGHAGGADGMNGELQICSSGYTIVVLANVDPPVAMRLMRFLRYRLPK
jgi:D-alanyl-D-alanine carboxypeptidase